MTSTQKEREECNELHIPTIQVQQLYLMSPVSSVSPQFFLLAHIFYRKIIDIILFGNIYIIWNFKEHSLNSIITPSKINNNSVILFYINFHSDLHDCVKKIFTVFQISVPIFKTNKQANKQTLSSW